MAEPWPRDRFRAAVLSSACTLSTPQRLVAVALSEYATRWERAQVSHAGLIAATGLSQSSIARALDGLAAGNWIEIEVTPGGGRQTGRFRMLRQTESRHADDSESPHRDESPEAESRHGDVESRHGDVESRHGDDQSQVPSQFSSQDVGDWPGDFPSVVPGQVTAVVDEVARSTSLTRDREVEEAVDWLVLEHHMPVDEARAFVEKNAPASKANHPARFLKAWKPADIDRKRPAPRRSGSVRRAASRLCEHDRPLPAGYEPGDICCGEAETRPHVASAARAEAAS